MGRKLRGASLRAHKRGKDHAKEIVEQTADLAETSHLAEMPNEQLFVIDTVGSTKKKKQPALMAKFSKTNATSNNQEDTTNNNKNKNQLSKLEQEKVERLIQKHDPKTLQTMAKEGQAKLRGDRNAVRRSQRNKKNGTGKYDLWENEDDAKHMIKSENAKLNATLKRGGTKPATHVQKVAETISKPLKNAVALDVARSGQSYRPDPKAYKSVVQVAVSLELRRQQAQDLAKAPLAAGMSAETKALLVGDTDTSDDEDDDDNEDDKETSHDTTTKIMPKRQEKLTRAERNKQKRLRHEKVEQEKQRQAKKLLNSVSEIPRYKKEIKKHEQHLQEKKQQLQAIKISSQPTLGKNVLERVSKQDPIHVPTFPVALETEHQDASLRTIKPKGSLLTDRMTSFADRKLVTKKRVGEMRRVKQGKRRKLNVKGKGHEIAKAMDYAMMG